MNKGQNKNATEVKSIYSQEMRVVMVTLREYMLDEHGMEIECIPPYQIKSVVLKYDLKGLGQRNVEDSIKLRALDCVGMLFKAISEGEIKL